MLLLDEPTEEGAAVFTRLRHLYVGESRPGMTVQLADGFVQHACNMLEKQPYSSQLRVLSLRSPVGSSCWPLVEAVFGYSQLRRCELVMNFHLWNAQHTRDTAATLAALRPAVSPPALPTLRHLHSLKMWLPLCSAELQRVLRAASAVRHLRLGFVYSLDALQVTRLVARLATPGLRTLSINTEVPFTAESCRGSSQPAVFVAPSSARPFPSLIQFNCCGPLEWRAAPLQAMVELLHHAPLLYCNMAYTPWKLLYLLPLCRTSARC